MSDLEYSYSFEDGVEAGNQLLELIFAINAEREPECSQFLSEAQLTPIFEELWRRSEYKRPLRCVEGFLSRTLKARRLNGEIITLWGADELFANQSEWAPICNIPPELGVVQLGYWTGQSDGDGWCLDTAATCIRCVYVGSGDEDLSRVQLGSYGVFHSLYQWVAYLRCSAWERGWIEKP